MDRNGDTDVKAKKFALPRQNLYDIFVPIVCFAEKGPFLIGPIRYRIMLPFEWLQCTYRNTPVRCWAMRPHEVPQLTFIS